MLEEHFCVNKRNGWFLLEVVSPCTVSHCTETVQKQYVLLIFHLGSVVGELSRTAMLSDLPFEMVCGQLWVGFIVSLFPHLTETSWNLSFFILLLSFAVLFAFNYLFLFYLLLYNGIFLDKWIFNKWIMFKCLDCSFSKQFYQHNNTIQSMCLVDSTHIPKICYYRCSQLFCRANYSSLGQGDLFSKSYLGFTWNSQTLTLQCSFGNSISLLPAKWMLEIFFISFLSFFLSFSLLVCFFKNKKIIKKNY